MAPPADRLEVADLRKFEAHLVIAGLTKRQLAARAGQGSHSYVCAVLRGEVTAVSRKFASAIAEALGVDIAALFVPAVSKNPGRAVQKDAA